jgi:hypothetical protein
LARRNLTKGQQAMALAMIYPDPEKGGRGNKKERVAESAALFSATRLKQARSVLRHSAKLAEAGRRCRGPSKPISRNSQPARGLVRVETDQGATNTLKPKSKNAFDAANGNNCPCLCRFARSDQIVHGA